MNDDLWNKRLVMFLLPLLVLVFYVTASSHFGYSPDDTYIYLQFAKNFIHGQGISFNAGESTYGFTSPLWMFIIVFFSKSGLDLFVTAKVLDLCLASGALIVFYLLAYEVIRDIFVALLATIAFSLNVWFIRWAGTGMETSLSVLLVLLTLLFCLRNEYLLSIIFSAMLTLVRPESCLLAGFIFYDIYINSNNKRRAVNFVVSMGSIFVAFLLPWLVYAYRTLGTIVPNTVRAKSGMIFDLQDTVIELWNIVTILAASDGIAIVVLVVSTVILFNFFRKNDDVGKNAEEKFFVVRQSVAGIGWIVVLPLLYSFMHVHVVSRYLLLIIPLISIFAFAFVFRILLQSKYNRLAYAGVVLLAGLSIFQNQTVYHMVVKPGIEAFEEGVQSCLIPIGVWLKDHTEADDVVMAQDIGVIGYYSERKICDVGGLASPQMISFIHQGYSFNRLVEEKMYRSQCNVKYIVHRALEPEELKYNPGLIPLFTKPFYRLGLMKMQFYYYTVYKVAEDSLSSNDKQ